MVNPVGEPIRPLRRGCDLDPVGIDESRRTDHRRLRLELELERGRLRAESGGGDADTESDDKSNLGPRGAMAC